MTDFLVRLDSYSWNLNDSWFRGVQGCTQCCFKLLSGIRINRFNAIAFGNRTEVQARNVEAWCVIYFQYAGKPSEGTVGSIFQNHENYWDFVLGSSPKSGDPVISGTITNQCYYAAIWLCQLDTYCGRQAEAQTTSCREVIAARVLKVHALPESSGRRSRFLHVDGV